MSRSLDKRLDKQSDNQELFKAGSTFPFEKEARAQSNSQISTDNESEVRKPDSDKEEQTKTEKNGIKSKAWKVVAGEETNGDVIKESNGTTIQHASSDSPDNKTSDKLDSPTSSSTPNDSSEMSSLSESPSLLHDDPKLKISNIITTSITSEDESSSKMDASENNRICKKRRWDERDQNGNEDDEHDENDKPRVEVQEDLKMIERDFVQLRDQLYREQIQELEKEIAEIKQGVHPDQISCMDEIDKKRRKRSEITSSRKRYQELHCQKQYEESEYRTYRQFWSDRYALKRHILDDLENRRFKLIREKNNLDDSSRIEPLHTGDIDEDFALMGISKETLVQVHDPSPSSTSPQISTISRPNISDNNNNPFLSQECLDVCSLGDRFSYLGQSFKKGDAVLVIDSTSGQYAAKFLSATDSEVVIQRPDGSKPRIQMNLLKEGKYQIQLKDLKES
ncbi:Sds3-like-domain-containing protein [Gigaspora rosea]|uniref:Sds3-like-domain-containing protein n=1 Tax=Gigaspora rosea TaxID=44941 RepID=A0A397V8J4_9GLOM|nr:Sds3-like-domain-containing protein [Gigaspora rosea]